MKRMLKVLNGEAINQPPFWFMRQAGRYLDEYQKVRAQAGSFLKLCFNPELAAEVTMQPIRRFGMDAAILFADILLIPIALGMEVKFENGEGPKLGKLETGNWKLDERKLEPIYNTLKILTTQLRNTTQPALIGFAGAPWTVATYMIEGGSSRDFAKSKEFSRTKEFIKLIDILVDATSQYLISQINAGAEVIQIFDSWASALEGAEFEKFVIEPNARIIANLKKHSPQTPVIGFPKGAKDLIKFVQQTRVDAISIGSETDISWAFANLDCVIQGNFDPQLLLGSKEKIKTEAEKILAAARGKPFIFNLGHGINQHTPVENVEFLCNVIRGNL